MKSAFNFEKYNQQFLNEMADEPGDQTPPGDDQTPPGDQAPAGAKKPDPENMIPKSRFDEVNTKFKDMQKQLQTLLDEKKAADELTKKEQGKFEELYTTASGELNTFKNKAEQLEARTQQLEGLFTTMLETKLASIPADFHDLIPENLTAEAKLAWIDKAAAKGLLTDPKNPTTPVGGQTNPPPGNNTKPPQAALAEAAEKARKSGRADDKVAYVQLKHELGL